MKWKNKSILTDLLVLLLLLFDNLKLTYLLHYVIKTN